MERRQLSKRQLENSSRLKPPCVSPSTQIANGSRLKSIIDSPKSLINFSFLLASDRSSACLKSSISLFTPQIPNCYSSHTPQIPNRFQFPNITFYIVCG
ncbi:hypothetical protein P8452_65369 [Trifolium repens]|nr:hypothetical protein P8452_65369 [Trifolium repens]